MVLSAIREWRRLVFGPPSFYQHRTQKEFWFLINLGFYQMFWEADLLKKRIK